MTHDLKIHPEYFDAIDLWIKTFEIRRNDRNFKVGDELRLREYDPVTKQYTGREANRTVSYITNYWQMQDFVVMGFKINHN